MEPAGYAVLTWADAGVFHICVAGSVMSFGNAYELAQYLMDRERSMAAGERERSLAKAKWDAALKRDMDAQRATHVARQQREQERLLKKASQRVAAQQLDARGKSALALLMRKGLV